MGRILLQWYICWRYTYCGLCLVGVSPISGRRNEMLNHLKVLVSWFLCLSSKVTVDGHSESWIYGSCIMFWISCLEFRHVLLPLLYDMSLPSRSCLSLVERKGSVVKSNMSHCFSSLLIERWVCRSWLWILGLGFGSGDVIETVGSQR
jgi:hypothetical protein